jgi:hypothetical protein
MLLVVCGVVGLFLLVASVRAVAWVREEMSKPSFVSSGFVFERCGPYQGWLNRDPHNGDWIMWDTKQHRMFRGSTNDAFHWVPSSESKSECIRIGNLNITDKTTSRSNALFEDSPSNCPGREPKSGTNDFEG